MDSGTRLLIFKNRITERQNHPYSWVGRSSDTYNYVPRCDDALRRGGLEH